MANTIDIQTSKTISLNECKATLDIEKIDFTDPQQTERAAQILKMLSNNKRFLVDYISQELNANFSYDAFQRDSNYTQQIIDLGFGDNFRLRANLWLPTRKELPEKWEKLMFAYHLPHDHTEDFMTIGHWGPGYKTQIFEYESESVIGLDGEPVALTFLEHTSLPDGKIMYYRANKDIHTQLPPDDFSISLNLLQTKATNTNQYWFDTKNSKIDSRVGASGTYSSFHFLCTLAKQVGGDHIQEKIESIAIGHKDSRIRNEAYTSLIFSDNCDSSYFLNKAKKDSDPFVREMANINSEIIQNQ